MLRLLIRIVAWSCSSLFASSIVLTLLFRFVNPPVTAMQIVRANEAYDAGKPVKIDRDWVSLDRMSPHISAAIIASEDQLFYDHFGFDFNSIEKAANSNQRSRTVRGASTLSQQVAKNLFLWPGRDYIRKGLEAYFTLLIELLWSKERILEVYLNIAETGDGIFGVQMAAERYFDTTAAKLSLGQSALIAASLPNPRRMNPDKPSKHLRQRAVWIVRAVKRAEQEEAEAWGDPAEESAAESPKDTPAKPKRKAQPADSNADSASDDQNAPDASADTAADEAPATDDSTDGGR